MDAIIHGHNTDYEGMAETAVKDNFNDGGLNDWYCDMNDGTLVSGHWNSLCAV